MNNEVVAVGTYTNYVGNAPNANGKGIIFLSLNRDNGQLTELNSHYIINPSYLSWSKDDKKLYCCTETEEGTGQVLNFVLNKQYNLEPINKSNNKGSALCFITKPDNKGTLFAASYRDGMIYKISQDSNSFNIDYEHKYSGKGPNIERQESPHAHQVVRHPNNDFIYTCDLGSDKVWIDKGTNNTPTDDNYFETPPGYGPRHLTFDSRGEYAYILCELKPRLLVAEVNSTNGKLKLINDYPSTKHDTLDLAAPAGIKLHPSGKTVAVSNRVVNTISIFKIVDNTLTLLTEFESKGDHPRDINFTKDGDWLLIGNQDSNTIEPRAFYIESGEPKPNWGPSYILETPACLITID